MDEVRRASDGELCGFVASSEDGWVALTVFGASLGRHETRDDAVEQVLADGLSSLVDRWTLRNGATGDEEIVCIVEAHPGEVTVARDYYALPGVPRLTVTSAQLAAGEWELRR